MDLGKILTISGKPGLYKVISNTENSLIAESLEDGKRLPVFASSRSSTLEDISIFTLAEDIPLKEVFWKIHETEEGKKTSVEPKADDQSLKSYFEKIVPEYDKDRVYPSDIKKALRWYNILLDNKLITKPEKEDKDKKQADGKKDPKDQNLKKAQASTDIKKHTTKVKPAKDTSKYPDVSAAQKGKTKNVKTKKV